MENKWNDASAQAAIEKYNYVHEDIALRVYTSRLIGADPTLVRHGGGNTSVKSRVRNKVNEEVDQKKMPLMLGMINAIVDDKKLELDWESFR